VTLHRVDVRLADAVAVVILRPIPPRSGVADPHMAPAEARQAVVPLPFVRVDGRPLQRRALDDPLQGRAVGAVDDLKPGLARLPADHRGDRRSVVGERP
jgi:hypothetical protein